MATGLIQNMDNSVFHLDTQHQASFNIDNYDEECA